jgi:hypothetical protein
MIYAVGHVFVVNKSSNPNFKIGMPYQLYHIKPIKENDIKKFKYTFTERSGIAIDVVFNNPFEADSFIARMSGKVSELEKERARVKSIQEADAF